MYENKHTIRFERVREGERQRLEIHSVYTYVIQNEFSVSVFVLFFTHIHSSEQVNALRDIQYTYYSPELRATASLSLRQSVVVGGRVDAGDGGRYGGRQCVRERLSFNDNTQKAYNTTHKANELSKSAERPASPPLPPPPPSRKKLEGSQFK